MYWRIQKHTIATIDIDSTRENYVNYVQEGHQVMRYNLIKEELGRAWFKLVDAFGEKLRLVDMSEDNVKMVVSFKRMSVIKHGDCHISIMARRRRTNKRRTKTVKKGLRQDEVWNKGDETKPIKLGNAVTDTVIPWRDQLALPREVLKMPGQRLVLPDRYSNLYQAREKQADYNNHVYRTAHARFGVQRKNLYRDLHARDVVYSKGSAVKRLI